MRISELGESQLIRRIARLVRTDRTVLRGIGDDCAVLAPPPASSAEGRSAPQGPVRRRRTESGGGVAGTGDRLLLFASDMLVEGVHFLRSAPPPAIGWKTLAVNVSDVAAMGGIPRHAVVSLGLPRRTPVAFVDGLYRGLRRCAARFGVNVVGGDTNRSERVVLDVAILGEVERERVVYRAGARPGDALLVTGRLGGAVRSGRHLTFIPRVREARAIGARVRPNAMIDLSDGLGQDLMRLCEASGVSAWVELADLPRHRGCSPVQALAEGEDFELLMAVEPSEASRLLRWARRGLSCGLHRIGEVTSRRGDVLITLQAPRRMRIPPSLSMFRHF